MDNKWNIAEKPGVYEKCCKMENIIRRVDRVRICDCTMKGYQIQ